MSDPTDADKALRAMYRAAVTAHERAARFGHKIPIWRDGAIVFIEPDVEARRKTLEESEGRADLKSAETLNGDAAGTA